MFRAWGDNVDAKSFLANHRLTWQSRFCDLGSSEDNGERHNFLSHCPFNYSSMTTADQITTVEAFLVEHAAALKELDAMGASLQIMIRSQLLIDIGNPQSTDKRVHFEKSFLRALSPFFPQIVLETYVDAVNFNALPEDVQRQHSIG